MSSDSGAKDPSRVARGKRGAAIRWNGQRIVRIDSLTGPQRAVIVALIETMKGSVASEVPTEPVGGRRDRVNLS